MTLNEAQAAISDLINRELTQARYETQNAKDTWNRTLQGTGETVHQHFARLSQRLSRAHQLQADWYALQKDYLRLKERVEELESASQVKSADDIKIQPVTGAGIDRVILYQDNGGKGRCPVCDHQHVPGVLCGADVIIGGHADNPYCGPGETETTHCACQHGERQVIPVSGNDLQGILKLAKEDRCLCGGVGCNSCEPQGRG